MDAAKLNTMTLAELRREGVEHGIPRASLLSRAELIELLLAPPAPSSSKSRRKAAPTEEAAEPPPPPATTAAPGSTEKAPEKVEKAAPSTKTTDKTGKETSARARKKTGSEPTVPSETLPDRPGEQDPEVMAGLYLEQGQPERAAEIYRELLAVTPTDEQLVARLAQAEEEIARRARRNTERGTPPPHYPPPPPPPHPHEGEPFGMLDFEELPESYGVDECEVMFRDPTHVFAYWEVTEDAIASARARIGGEGEALRLVLRLFTIGEPGEPGTGRGSHDYPIEWRHGRRYLPTPHPGVRLRAAVGLLSPTGLFVPIAQSSVVRVPPAEPAAPGEVEWMEVEPVRAGAERPGPIRTVPRAGGERGVFPPAERLGATAPGEAPSSPTGGARPTSPWRIRSGPGGGGSGSGSSRGD